MRAISVQTHETVHRIERGVNRVENLVDAIGDNSYIKELVPLSSATGEDHDICLHGTRIVVLESIRQWVNDPSAPQLWWLTDVAGAGKSTIAKQLSTEWKDEGRLGGCFFFNKNRPDVTNKQGFCDTLAAQIANNQPQLRSSITQGIKEIGPILSVCRFEEKLEKLVIQPMKNVALVLVIDALDECDDRDRLIILRSLLSSLPQAPRLKILITSRPERDIAQLLDTYRSRTNNLHDVELKSNRDDIAAFVKHKMGELVRSSELAKEDVDRLAKRVNCLFILASTACKVVEDSLDPQAAVQELLNPNQDLLHDINTLYFTILTKVCKANQIGRASTSKSQELLIKVLKVVLAASTPLTISTIDGFLGIKNTRRLIGFLSSILSIRADDIVLILHPTFREFLEDPTAAGHFHIDMTDAHKLVAKRCLENMRRELRFNICRLESSFVLNRDVLDLKDRISNFISNQVQYGCVYWPDHIVKSNITSADRDVHHALVGIVEDGYPLFWIEVTSALGKIPTAIKGLQDVERHDLGEGLKGIINDIKRFLIAFSTPISEGIPHIYISAIPFTPKRSYIRRMANALYPNTMSVFIGCPENWPEPPQEWLGHTRGVTSISFSPDGRRIVSGSEDQTIRLWDAETGQPLGEPLLGHSNAVWSVAFSPDGHRIVSGSLDKTVRLWDAGTGQPLGAPLRGHSGIVRSVAFSPDGCYIVSGSGDHLIRLWDAETGQPLGEPIRGHSGTVRSVAFSPNGCRIVSGSEDKTIQLWDAKTGRSLGEPIHGHTGTVSSVTFSPDGCRVVSGSSDKTIRLWNAETGQPLGAPLLGHSNSVRSIALSPDGRRIVSGSSDKTIRLWDAETGQALGQPFLGHSNAIRSVAFSPDGRRTVSGSSDKTIWLWDAETGQPLGEPLRSHSNAVYSVAFSLDGRRVASGSSDKTIRVWDAETGQPLGEPLRGHSGTIYSVGFSPDGRHIVSASSDNTIHLWDAETGRPVGEPLRDHSSIVCAVAFSPDGRRIVSGSSDKTVRLWNVETGQSLGEPLRGHSDAVHSVAFSPDGRRIVSGSEDKTIRLWDAETGQPLRGPLLGHSGAIWSVSFSPDGLCIVSGSKDTTIWLWDAGTGQPLGEPLRGHSDAVQSVSFSPDGLCIVSGSGDCTIRLWDAETRQPLGGPLRGHSSTVYSVSFSPDGRRIVSGSEDKTTRLWNEIGQVLQTSAQDNTDPVSSTAIPSDGGPVELNAPNIQTSHSRLISGSHFTPPGFFDCSLSKDGWISFSGGVLYWAPPDYRSGLQHPYSLTFPTTSSSRATWIDFTHFHCGTFWTKCRK
ncbi:hypothetical protein FRB91_000901 [Serendipita sp. 411]|nr:hypothetical protein FRB91_000901 [Serendipita sp. 411]